MTILVILLPSVAAILATLLPFRKRVHWEIFLESAVILNSILVWYLLLISIDMICISLIVFRFIIAKRIDSKV